MEQDKVPDPLKKAFDSGLGDHVDPYSKGFIPRKHEEDGELEEGHVQQHSVLPPSLGHRLSNLFWSTAAVTAGMAVVRHYDAMEGALMAALAGLGG
jgi:hypothetical protein